jgi:type IV pilus assembly protein PilA
MFKAFRKQEGFTLIELMIVVAIIGILAAIAIPNFLTYQLKSRQAEAKTNLQAIKTSEVAFQAERGCYLGIPPEGAVAAANVKSVPFTWGVGAGPTAPGAAWCTTAPLSAGFFSDIGFKATGNVNYLYAVDGTTVAVPYTAALSCAVAGATGVTGAAVLGSNNFVASAVSNLDGDNAATSISVWDSSVDHGANDCTTGVY